MYVDMKQLEYVVVCKSTLAFFETIAAFDCEPIADIYMRDCRKANPMFQYKIVKQKKGD